jgi:hypothetical protein
MDQSKHKNMTDTDEESLSGSPDPTDEKGW